MDILEDLKLEVIGTLYTLSSDHLIAVCDFLKISGTEHENVLDKGRSFLISHIVKHVERDEVNELEDQGMSFLLNLKDKIAEIQLPIEIQPIIQNPVELRQHEVHVAQMSEQERLKKQIEALQLALQLSMHPKQSESNHEVQGVSQNDQTVQSVSARDLSQPLFWQREFKISGQIGEPGQRDKLSFSSLAHQIENGIKKNFPEHEIVHAVIKAISPGMQLRSYLEGRTNLTLPTLRRILRSHYQERGATELYKQLMAEVQDSKETPQTFLIRVLDLRQKILFASQEAESSLKYDPVLVQNMFLHTILTGLHNDYIRSDLKPYLQQSDVSDELLLEKLNIACMTEAERQNKKKTTTQHRSVAVHSAETHEVLAPTEKKGRTPVQISKNQHPPELLNELREIRSDMALLKNLSAEVSQIRESIQLPQTYTEQSLASPRRQSSASFNQLDQMAAGYWPSRGMEQRYRTAQFQQRFAPQRHFFQNRSRLRMCFNCQQSDTDNYCTHCYRCGSSEHFHAGCRARSADPPGGANLNERGSLPRDRERPATFQSPTNSAHGVG